MHEWMIGTVCCPEADKHVVRMFVIGTSHILFFLVVTYSQSIRSYRSQYRVIACPFLSQSQSKKTCDVSRQNTNPRLVQKIDFAPPRRRFSFEALSLESIFTPLLLPKLNALLFLPSLSRSRAPAAAVAAAAPHTQLVEAAEGTGTDLPGLCASWGKLGRATTERACWRCRVDERDRLAAQERWDTAVLLAVLLSSSPTSGVRA